MSGNTKGRPGEFDAFEKARPDELIFTLLERDPDAPPVIFHWCDLRRARSRQIPDVEKRVAELKQISEAEFIGIEMQERRKTKGAEAPPTETKALYNGPAIEKNEGEQALAKYRAMLSEADFFAHEALELATGRVDGAELGRLQALAEEIHELAITNSPHRAAIMAERDETDAD